ncbi:MAG: protein translocase subunit SecDF [Cytophagales bacterium]|nr:protein translocase subunit SecDF [Cytophagales bacterium]
MKNKLGIIILSSFLALVSAYFIIITLISQGVQSDAEAMATDASGKIDYVKKQKYLDSLWTQPVVDFLGFQLTFKELKEQELHLGLDLQGGMHVVMEVSPVEIIKTLSANNTDPRFIKALNMSVEDSKNSQKKFTTLFYENFKANLPDTRLAQIFANSVNKVSLNFNSSDEEVLKVIDNEIEGAISRSFQILRTRIDKFGVTQPNIQRLKGTGRIQLELPGVDNPERVRKLLQGTAKLEFVEVWEGDKFGPYFDALNKFLVKQEQRTGGFDIFKDKIDTASATSDAGDSAVAKDASDKLFATSPTLPAAPTTTISPLGGKKDSITLASSKTQSEVAKSDSASKSQSKTLAKLFVPIYNGVGANVTDTGKVNKLFNMPEIKAILPSNMKILWAVKGIQAEDGNEYLPLYFIKRTRDGKAPLTGEVIVEARQDFDQSGQAEVNMQMNAIGAKKWRKLTQQNIGRRVAIVLDDYVYSAPVVQGEIPNGNSSISGNFSVDEAKDLANILKAGKLPAPTRIVEEAIIGPSLGAEAISQGYLSTLIGLVAVIIFMILYYNTGGGVADLALFINLFFIVGILTQMQAVLTLPGIAGIVLTMGMAVDANVLIYERIREELRAGRTMIQAIGLGYQRANSSIVDANATTFLVGAILAFYGSGPVQGFAVTLMIGIITSFFTSVYITRIVFEAWAHSKSANLISFSNRITDKLFGKSEMDVVGLRKYSYMFSSIIIIIGFVCIFINGGLNLGVDFKGGRSYVVKFDTPVVASEVREAVLGNFKNTGTEVKTFGSDDKLKINTSYLYDDETEEGDKAVETAMMKGLQKYANLHPTVLSTSKVGATIADDIKQTSLLSIVLSLAGIFIYILIRFRKWQYSLGAIIALFHDVLMAIALTGVLASCGIIYEIDQVYIAAILTVVGYSINDTVVVFDRLREFISDNPRAEVSSTINLAINNTFSRTIITSVTVFLVVVILYFFGGEVLKGFSFVLIVGVVFGSYSSIFIASPIVVDFQRKKALEAKPIASK